MSWILVIQIALWDRTLTTVTPAVSFASCISMLEAAAVVGNGYKACVPEGTKIP